MKSTDQFIRDNERVRSRPSRDSEYRNREDREEQYLRDQRERARKRKPSPSRPTHQ